MRWRRGRDPDPEPLPGPQIEEGRLSEAPTPGAHGVERRAFGEFVSGRGEMASYAFGWTAEDDGPREARFTVGIGAGNPGGGTFHWVVFLKDGDYAFSLVDDVFEDVPQGGPDLSADEARAHDTLPFVFWVGDEVMERDRRARWMRHWLRGTTAIETAEVADRAEPVLLVVHEDDDHEIVWQLIGTSDAGDDGKLEHLHHHLEQDPTLREVADLPPGTQAERDHVGGPWRRSPYVADD